MGIPLWLVVAKDVVERRSDDELLAMLLLLEPPRGVVMVLNVVSEQVRAGVALVETEVTGAGLETAGEVESPGAPWL